jgi:hypothetical protein
VIRIISIVGCVQNKFRNKPYVTFSVCIVAGHLRITLLGNTGIVISSNIVRIVIIVQINIKVPNVAMIYYYNWAVTSTKVVVMGYL